MLTRLTTFAMVLVFALLATGAPAADPIAIENVKLDRPVDFNIDIRPILKKNCLACHHSTDPKGKLSLETVKEMLKGGDTGPAVEAGNPIDSLLLLTASLQEEPHMPPEKNKVDAERLTPRELGLIKLWIEQGAKGPEKAVLPEPTWSSMPTGWNAIYAVAVTGDGQYAAAGRAAQIHLYHVPSRRLVATLHDPALDKTMPGGAAHRDAVQSLAFSPDGTTLASGGYRSIKLWQRKLDARNASLGFSADPSKHVVAVSPDGKQLALGGPDKTVQLYNLADGKPAAKLEGHGEVVTAVAFSPDSQRVATSSNDKTARVWNAADGKQLTQVDGDKPVTSVGWVDDKRLATATDDNKIHVYELADKPNKLKELNGSGGRVVTLQPVPGQANQLLSTAHDGQTRLWDVNAGNQVRSYNHGGQVIDAAIAPDAAVASISNSQTLKLFKPDGNQLAELRTDGPAKIEQEQRRAVVGFAKSEVGYHENVVKEREKTLESEKDAVKKATEALAAAEKTVKEKTEEHDKAAKAFAEAETKFKEVEKKLADAKAKVEAAPKAVEVAKANVDKANNTVNDTRGKRDQAVNNANQAKSNYDNADRAFNDAKAKLDAADKSLAEARGKVEAADKAIADAKAKLAEADKALADAKDDNAKKAAEEAKKQAADAVTKAENDRKPLAEALAKADAERKSAEEAFKKAETDRKAAEKALADAEAAKKSAEEVFAKAEQAKKDADQKFQDAEKDKREAEAALRNIENEHKSAEKKRDDDKKKLADAKGAMEQAELNLSSAKRRLDKANMAVPEAEKAIADAKSQVEAAKKRQADAENQQKQADEAVGKATRPLTAVALSPDGSLVAVGVDDGRVFTFGATTGELAHVFNHHKAAVVALRFTADNTLVSVAADGSARLGDALPTWSLARTIAPAESTAPPIDRVLSLAFSPDGKLLASGGGMPSREGELALWNVADGKLVRDFPDAHSDTVFDVNFAPDGRRIATAASDRFAKIFNAETGELARSFEGHTHHVLGVTWNRDGRILATSSADNTIKVWDVVKGERTKTIDGFNKEITALRHMGYGDRFAVAWGGGPVRIVGENGRRERDLPNSSGFMHAVAVTDNGNLIVAGGQSSTLHIWDANGKEITRFEAPQPQAAPK